MRQQEHAEQVGGVLGHRYHHRTQQGASVDFACPGNELEERPGFSSFRGDARVRGQVGRIPGQQVLQERQAFLAGGVLESRVDAQAP